MRAGDKYAAIRCHAGRALSEFIERRVKGREVGGRNTERKQKSQVLACLSRTAQKRDGEWAELIS